MFAVELSQEAQKFLAKLDTHIRERVENRLKRLSDGPVPSDAKFIGRHDGEKVFRYRIGDYRAKYKVKENEKIVLIVKLDKRSRAYE